LRDAQSELWGSTERAGSVRVRVDVISQGSLKQGVECQQDRNYPERYSRSPKWLSPFQGTALPYALFPFQGEVADRRKVIKVKPANYVERASFRLTLDCDHWVDFSKQVEPALWAWVNFGGVGSRTRRGCGAIFCKDLAPKNVDELSSMWKRHLPHPLRDRDWPTPTIGKRALVSTKLDPLITSYDVFLCICRQFLQGEGMGRNPGQGHNRPGRSRWPEPETIRRLTGKRNKRYMRMEEIPEDAFPRAELGLPIVFHFKDEGDPGDVQLDPSANAKG